MGKRGYRYTKDQVKQLKTEFLSLLEKNMGIITPVAKQMHISRDVIIRWRKDDPDFDAAIENTNEITTDFVENALLKKIQEGDTSSIIFYLKTKAKSRGYVERFDLDATIRRPRIIYEGDTDDVI